MFRMKQIVPLLLCGISMFLAQARERCALIKETNSEVSATGQPAYIELEPVTVGNDFSLEMTVQTSAFQPNGNLFAVGSQREFPYYAYASWFHALQFLVLEVTEQSVCVTIKQSGDRYTKDMCVSHTWPNPYELFDGDFHTIIVSRTPSQWVLSVDGAEETRPVSEFDVQLQNKPAFIAGRPGYTSFQIRGIIKNLGINGAPVAINGVAINGRIQVTRCGSDRYSNFVRQLGRERSRQEDYENSLVYEPYYSDHDDGQSDDSMTSFNSYYNTNNNNNQNHAVLPGIFR